MADEEKKEEAEAAPKVRQPLFSSKGMIVVVIIVVIQTFLVYFVSIMMSSEKPVDENASSTTVNTSMVIVDLKEIEIFFPVVGGSLESEKLLLHIVLELEPGASEDSAEKVKTYRFKLRDQIIELATGVDINKDNMRRYEYLNGEFKNKIKDLMNEALGGDIIKAVLYNNIMPLAPY